MQIYPSISSYLNFGFIFILLFEAVYSLYLLTGIKGFLFFILAYRYFNENIQLPNNSPAIWNNRHRINNLNLHHSHFITIFYPSKVLPFNISLYWEIPILVLSLHYYGMDYLSLFIKRFMIILMMFYVSLEFIDELLVSIIIFNGYFACL